jgi:hypothetical protein
MAELSMMSDRVGDVTKAILSVGGGAFDAAPARTPAPVAIQNDLDLTPYLQKLNETIAALKESRPPMLPISAAPSTPASAEAELISREAYLINGTLLPLLRFMAHRFRGYRAVNDPRIKAVIAKLERVDNLESLIAALENINVSALAGLTDEKRDAKQR